MSERLVPDDDAWLVRALAALEAEQYTTAVEESSGGPQLYDRRDLPRLALRELARRQLKALGINPDAPGKGKHTGG